MINQKQNKSKKNKGVKISNARVGLGGTRATIPPPARKKFFGEAQARAGRKGKGVWGKEIPAPPERFFRSRRRGFLGRKSELFPTNTTTLN